MPLGDTTAGDAPAGEDLPLDMTPPRSVEPPAALLFDGATRDFPLDADGLYLPIDPVDQRVALALLTVRGTLAGTPTDGNPIRALKTIDPARIQAQVTDAVRVALARELKARNIRLLAVLVETPRDGALGATIQYQNLRLPRSAPSTTRTVPLSING